MFPTMLRHLKWQLQKVLLSDTISIRLTVAHSFVGFMNLNWGCGLCGLYTKIEPTQGVNVILLHYSPILIK